MQKPSVYIAIPTIRNGIVPQLVMNLIAWTHDDRYEIKINVPEGLQPADNARNTIVQDFLKTDCDYLWWIDDDIIPPPNTLCELVNTLLLRDDIDALSAVGFCMRADNGNYFPYPVTLKLDDKDKYTVYYGNDIEEVDAVGSGCVMVRRKVYKDVKRPYQFLYNNDGTLKLTCDFNFWRKVKACGYRLFVDFNILCDHQRVCSIKGIQDLLNKAQNGNQ